MRKDILERQVNGMLASPLVKEIIAELNPDMDKLRKAIREALIKTGFGDYDYDKFYPLHKSLKEKEL